MAKFVRVEMPVDSPKETLILCKRVKDRDTALGVNSPLAGFVDMAVFATKYGNANTLQTDGNTADENSQATFLICAKKSGLAPGQTKDSENTIYWYVVQIRDILLLKNRGTEETLTTFGFNVVISQTGARRNVRVDIPTKPETMIELGRAIITKHEALGVNTPLTAALVDMTAFETLVGDAETLLADWNAQKADAQTFHNQALTIMGYAEGQTSDTDGTLYYYLCIIRDRLLQKYQGIEESLSQWGFKVVLSTASTGPHGAAPVILQGTVAMGGTANIDLNGIDGLSAQTNIKLENPSTSNNRYYFTNIINGMPLTTFTDVMPGQVITKTIGELGGSDSNPFFTVQNTGTFPGNWKVTINP